MSDKIIDMPEGQAGGDLLEELVQKQIDISEEKSINSPPIFGKETGIDHAIWRGHKHLYTESFIDWMTRLDIFEKENINVDKLNLNCKEQRYVNLRKQYLTDQIKKNNSVGLINRHPITITKELSEPNELNNISKEYYFSDAEVEEAVKNRLKENLDDKITFKSMTDDEKIKYLEKLFGKNELNGPLTQEQLSNNYNGIAAGGLDAGDINFIRTKLNNIEDCQTKSKLFERNTYGQDKYFENLNEIIKLLNDKLLNPSICSKQLIAILSEFKEAPDSDWNFDKKEDIEEAIEYFETLLISKKNDDKLLNELKSEFNNFDSLDTPQDIIFNEFEDIVTTTVVITDSNCKLDENKISFQYGDNYLAFDITTDKDVKYTIKFLEFIKKNNLKKDVIVKKYKVGFDLNTIQGIEDAIKHLENMLIK